MAYDPRAATRRTRDEPGAADERRSRLRFGFPHPHARAGAICRAAASAFRGGVPKIRVRTHTHPAVGWLALHSAAQGFTPRRVVLATASIEFIRSSSIR